MNTFLTLYVSNRVTSKTLYSAIACWFRWRRNHARCGRLQNGACKLKMQLSIEFWVTQSNFVFSLDASTLEMIQRAYDGESLSSNAQGFRWHEIPTLPPQTFFSCPNRPKRKPQRDLRRCQSGLNAYSVGRFGCRLPGSVRTFVIYSPAEMYRH